MIQRGKPALQRFWEKVDKNGGPPTHIENWEFGGCWNWTAATMYEAGHGGFCPEKRTYAAHRYSWEIHNGPIPEGLWVLHKCDNPKCVNPSHLFLGTNLDNIKDMVEKGRHAIGEKHWTSKHPEQIKRGEQKPNSKLNEEMVKEMRRLRKDGLILRDIAVRFGVTITSVCGVCCWKSWKHVKED